MHCFMEEQPYSLLMYKISVTDGKMLKTGHCFSYSIGHQIYSVISIYSALYHDLWNIEKKYVLKKTSFMPDIFFSVLEGKI